MERHLQEGRTLEYLHSEQPTSYWTSGTKKKPPNSWWVQMKLQNANLQNHRETKTAYVSKI